ncbi:alpha/beta hydrolase fold domain-containing protein [Curtobacterium sp. MCPF17_052]|nr:alpha/beta hydrolase fold domain-containing protein [Curtobacterium sp. MCPF17_052]WIB11373.1 alpha/beta hydrolase fold domain-containing protein [Curtobacterium sp. MCPF17_052]
MTTTLAARDAGLPVPAGIVAFSPGLDHTRTGASMTSKEGIDPLFTRAGMEHTGTLYLDGQDPEQPLLAPAVHADLRGVPADAAASRDQRAPPRRRRPTRRPGTRRRD